MHPVYALHWLVVMHALAASQYTFPDWHLGLGVTHASRMPSHVWPFGHTQDVPPGGMYCPGPQHARPAVMP